MLTRTAHRLTRAAVTAALQGETKEKLIRFGADGDSVSEVNWTPRLRAPLWNFGFGVGAGLLCRKTSKTDSPGSIFCTAAQLHKTHTGYAIIAIVSSVESSHLLFNDGPYGPLITT
jgi:hypothetical protein